MRVNAAHDWLSYLKYGRDLRIRGKVNNDKQSRKKGSIVLLTGATGFLGSQLLHRLLQENHEVLILKRSFSSLHRIQATLDKYNGQCQLFNLDEIELESIFSGRKIDFIIHCATDYGNKALPRSSVLDANLILPLNLLEIGSKYGISAFVNTDTILSKRVSEYSLSKKQFVEWLATFAQALTTINISLEHFYGPGDDDTKFVSRMVRLLVSGAPSIPLTPGEQKRDFVFIDDVIEAFMAIIKNHTGANAAVGFHNYQVGTGKSFSIRTFMGLLKSLTGNTTTVLDFGALPYRENETMEYAVDISPIEKLGWTAQTDLETGLKKTIEHVRGDLKCDTSSPGAAAF